MRITRYSNPWMILEQRHETHIWAFLSRRSIAVCFVIHGYGFKIHLRLPQWKIRRWFALNVWLRNKWTYRILRPFFKRDC